MTTTHTELCECDCLNYCGDDPDLPKRKARPCRNAIDWAHKQALAIEAERERQRKIDLFESQAARIQQQALEYLSLFDQCNQHLARIAELEKERDALKADAERYEYLLDCDVEAARRYLPSLDADEFKNVRRARHSAALQAEKENRVE